MCSVKQSRSHETRICRFYSVFFWHMADSTFSLHCLSQLSHYAFSLHFFASLSLHGVPLLNLILPSNSTCSLHSLYLLPHLVSQLPLSHFLTHFLSIFTHYFLNLLSLFTCSLHLLTTFHFLTVIFPFTFYSTLSLRVFTPPPLCHSFVSLTHFLTPLTIYFKLLPSQSAMLSIFSLHSRLSLFSLYLCSTFSFYFLSSFSESNILLYIFLLFPARPSYLFSDSTFSLYFSNCLSWFCHFSFSIQVLFILIYVNG